MLALASTVSAGELSEAVMAGDMAMVRKLLAEGAPADGDGKGPPPLYVALFRNHAEVALLLAEHGAMLDPGALEFFVVVGHKTAPACLKAIRCVLKRGSMGHAVPAAAIMWEIGPAAAPEALSWLEGTPQEVAAALLAFRRIAGDSKEVLSVLAARDDAYETLGWNGHADPAVVRRLAQGVAEGRDDALLACTRVRWPKKADEPTAEAIAGLRAVLGKAREKGKLKYLDDIRLALSGKGANPSIAGHPVGRTPRRSAGSRGTPEEKAVEAGLRWLAMQQNKGDGSWGAPEPLYKVGVTALAVLAFLGAGHYPYGGTEYAPNVEAGLQCLLNDQADDGVFGTRATAKYMYNHAIATLALCEAIHFCSHPLYEEAARRGVEFIETARNPLLAWRYDPRGGENDTSVTCHCLHALHMARLRGLDVQDESVAGGLQWLDKMTEPGTGVVGYNFPGGESYRPEELKKRFPPEDTYALTAAGTFCRLLFVDRGHKNPDRSSEKGADLCMGRPPIWDADDDLAYYSIDMYYWYWGALALHQFGGKPWREWTERIRKEIVPNQVREGPDAGSWPTADPWGREGGRVYATSMMVLVLETPYRYARAKGVR